MPIREKLKALRKQRGMSQTELAYKAGVHVATIRRAEQGLATPRGNALIKIADALDVSIDELVGRSLAA